MANNQIKIIVCRDADNNGIVEISVDAQCIVEIAKHIVKNEDILLQSASAIKLLDMAANMGNTEAASILNQLNPPKYMAVHPVTSYDGIIDFLANKYKKHRPIEHRWCMIGILFAREGSKIHKQLTEELEYYHYRSSRYFDLFVAGYEDRPWERDREKANFSSREFSKVVAQFEENSEWRYSGGSELMLTNVKTSQSNGITLDFSSSILINLDELVKNKGFHDIGYFFEHLFHWSRFSKRHRKLTWDFSDHYIKEQFPKEVYRILLRYLPKSSGNSIKEIASFAVKNIEKT